MFWPFKKPNIRGIDIEAKEPKVLAVITEEEVESLQSITRQEEAIRIMLDSLIEKQKDCLDQRSQWWESIKKNYELDTVDKCHLNVGSREVRDGHS